MNSLKGIIWASSIYSERTSVFFCILVYVLQDNALRAEKIYTVVQLFCLLQFTLGALVPRGLHYYAESQVSINRIQVRTVHDNKRTIDDWLALLYRYNKKSLYRVFYYPRKLRVLIGNRLLVVMITPIFLSYKCRLRGLKTRFQPHFEISMSMYLVITCALFLAQLAQARYPLI